MQCTDNDNCCPQGCSIDQDSDCALIYSELVPKGSLAQNSPQCTAWNAFRATIKGPYSKVTISGSLNPVGVSCTGPKADQICQALKTGNLNFSIDCDGRNWRTGNCSVQGVQIELSAANSICACPGNEFIARPCIGNENWGGAGTDTCNPPTQTLTVTCGK
ncbi:MAG: hypothetical protein HY744_11565 [Deltaproteobacteria bacterium]|nr:hypothetical protein [Deltaproteobacteria bacterium]